MARPKLNRKLLRLVGDALARGAPVSTFEDDLARKLRVSDRTVRKYAALINEQRDRDDAEHLKRARQQGRFVARAAAARHLKRADQLYADAAKLIARAARLDGKRGAAARLIAAIEASGRPVLDDGPAPVDAKEVEQEIKRTPVLLQIARDDRRDAALLIKRAEQADALAQGWFDKEQKIAGTYEPEPPAAPGSGRGPILTSPQRRAKMEVIRAALAARREAREASE